MSETADRTKSAEESIKLRQLTAAFTAFTDTAQLLTHLVRSAMQQSGAIHGAVLERAALDGLVRVADCDSGLPERMVIGDVRATLWGVLLGRTTLSWSRGEAAPRPFRKAVRWEQGVVVRIGSRQGRNKLLALGGPDFVATADFDMLRAMADIAAPSIETLELLQATQQSQALLGGMTELAGRLGAAVSPTELWEAITTGLQGLQGIEDAGVWGIAPGGNGPPVLIGGGAAHIMQSDAVGVRLGRLLDPATPPTVKSLVQRASRVGTRGSLVTLMDLSTSPRRVLAIVHDHPLDDLSKRVLASLAGAAAPAMRQVGMAAERRELLSGYTRSLRPSIDIKELDIGVEHHPNTSTPGAFGGDFYDWFRTGEHRFVIALGDVSGKGISAAGAASMLVWSLRAIGGPGAEPMTLLARLDDVVAKELDQDRFVTLALASLDTRDWDLKLLLAGHPPPLWVHRGVPSVVSCEAAPPLGVNLGGVLPSPVAMSLDPGDAVVLFTDGVTDAKDPAGVRYGSHRLVTQTATIVTGASWSAQTLATSLWESVHDWAGGPPDDDCAIVVVRRPG